MARTGRRDAGASPTNVHACLLAGATGDEAMETKIRDWVLKTDATHGHNMMHVACKHGRPEACGGSGGGSGWWWWAAVVVPTITANSVMPYLIISCQCMLSHAVPGRSCGSS